MEELGWESGMAGLGWASGGVGLLWASGRVESGWASGGVGLVWASEGMGLGWVDEGTGVDTVDVEVCEAGFGSHRKIFFFLDPPNNSSSFTPSWRPVATFDMACPLQYDANNSNRGLFQLKKQKRRKEDRPSEKQCGVL